MNGTSTTFGADLKIVIVGNAGTGKTSFLNVWTGKNFTKDIPSTIISEFGYKSLEVNKKIYRIQLWDVAGQDCNPLITKLFVKDSHGCLVFCEVHNEKSLNDTLKWKSAVCENAKFKDDSELPILLIENKIDKLIDGKETENKIKEFQEANKFLNYFRTSAKTKQNINEAMEYLITQIIEKLNECNDLQKSDSINNNIRQLIQNEDRQIEEKKYQCC